MKRIWKPVVLAIAALTGLIAVVFAALAVVIAAPAIAKLHRSEAPMPRYQQPRRFREPLIINGEFHEIK